jgi:hypothetical protein
MQEVDHAIKTVLTRSADSVLDLAFGKRRTIKLVGLADPQINIPELRADKVLVVKERGKVKYLICEAMLQPKRNKLLSFALKTLGNQYLLKKPSLLVILYLEKGRYVSFPNGFENRLGDFSTQFTCSTILLWEHEARILNGELKEFAAFLPLLHKRRDPRVIQVQRKLLAQISDPELREDLTAATILIDIRAFGAKVVLSEFTKKELNMVKETSFVQGWLTESLQKGKLSVIEVILQQKLGALPPRLRGQLQKLDDKKLDRLTVKLQQITSRKDLQTWLKNGASGHVSH